MHKMSKNTCSTHTKHPIICALTSVAVFFSICLFVSFLFLTIGHKHIPHPSQLFLITHTPFSSSVSVIMAGAVCEGAFFFLLLLLSWAFGCWMLVDLPRACWQQLVHGSPRGQMWQWCPPTAVFLPAFTTTLPPTILCSPGCLGDWFVTCLAIRHSAWKKGGDLAEWAAVSGAAEMMFGEIVMRRSIDRTMKEGTFFIFLIYWVYHKIMCVFCNRVFCINKHYYHIIANIIYLFYFIVHSAHLTCSRLTLNMFVSRIEEQ